MGDRKMNVKKVDNYSSDEMTIIETDNGKYFYDKSFGSKTCGQIFKVDFETNKVVQTDDEESCEVMDEFVHHYVTNFDEVGEEIDNGNTPYTDASDILYSLRDKE